MEIFDWFRRPEPIAEYRGLVDYLDSRAAFFVQKNIFDFAHACAGMSFLRLMKEPVFIEALDKSRWSSYPLGLSVLAEMVHGVLREKASGAMPLAEALRGAVFEAFDRYPVPPGIEAGAWDVARIDLGQRIIGIALHPPKAVKDIPMAVSRHMFKHLPISEKVRGDDQEIVINNLRLSLIRLYEDFVRRSDVAALVAELGVAGSTGGSRAAGS